ncbi:tail fiber domain-containing protein, partial [Chitinophaga sp.]|uniref:tail fiber domain-containing protein n=1 Tax=Chitinophaga sp. TaxID=1869181 RepID=UPI002F948996
AIPGQDTVNLGLWGNQSFIRNDTNLQTGNFYISGIARSKAVDATLLKSTAGTDSIGVAHYYMYNGAGVAGNLRWGQGLIGNQGAGDAGADFRIFRYSNTGSFISTALGIERSTGIATIPSGLNTGYLMVNTPFAPTSRLTVTDTSSTPYAPYSTTAAGPKASVASFFNLASVTNTYVGFNMQVMVPPGIYQSAYMGVVSTTDGVGYGAHMIFGQRTGLNAYAERMRITTGGLVGIGTTTPAAMLDVAGSVKATDLQITGTAAFPKLKTYGATGAGQLEIYGGTLDPNNIKNRRWSITRNNAESGLQTGSDFAINRHDSTGTLKDAPLKIPRSTGVVDMANGFIAASSSKIRGLSTGDANTSYLAFVEKNDTVRAGYVGKVSSVNGDVSLLSDKGNISLGAFGGGQFTLSRAFLMVSTGSILLTDTLSNMISYNLKGVAAPTFNSGSVGTKLLLYPQAMANNTNYAIGIDTGATWFSVPQSNLSYSWKYYGGTTLVSRLTAQGGQEWNGQGRFKGWYTSGSDPANGPAAEIGFYNGYATLIGCNRSTKMYMPLRLVGGSTLTDNKAFDIDSVGYRFLSMANAAVLSTDANGYLVKTLIPTTASTANTLALRDGGGSLTATSFLQSSRASLKKNIRIFNEDALALLMQVQVKQFVYKDDKQENVRVGIIADSTDWHFSTVAHDKFDINSSLAITMKAVQELNQRLKKENEDIRAENKILAAKLEEVLKRLTDIEQSVKKN